MALLGVINAIILSVESSSTIITTASDVSIFGTEVSRDDNLEKSANLLLLKLLL